MDFFGDLNPVVINSWDFQKKLKESVVLILGIGGLGSWIAQLLTMMGIGKLIICDFDYVEEHNLTRQTLYDINDIGTKKIDSLSRKLLLINDNLVVEKINKKIENKTDLLDLKKQICLSDVIINCADFPDINTTSTWVSELCMKFDKKHIIGGGYNGHTGLIGPSIIPYKSACWKCFDEKYKKEVENSDLEVVINTRKSAGAISVLSNIIASIQAWECVKLITDVDEIKTLNRRGFFNINTFEIEWEEIDEVDKCSTCRGECK
ncbi:Molybdopterin-synthase adenylyltransferase [Streptococcus oralis]|uniref:Molybdopterin-synthase adenylyltransferase n=1 Tax=Streptococcus oralis TaxID=1303 RepID=A0A3R9HHB4_STROR|nr:Molybdopterin-synthase adenylyltransferase [Streptococcus oralis]